MLMAQLYDVRVLVEKAWEEKDLMACTAIEEKLAEMDEIHIPSSTMERLLLLTDNRLLCLTKEVLNYGMLNELRCGAVSQSDVQELHVKTLLARASLETAVAHRNWAGVYKVYVMVSALVKPFQQKYRRTVFTQCDRL